MFTRGGERGLTEVGEKKRLRLPWLQLGRGDWLDLNKEAILCWLGEDKKMSLAMREISLEELRLHSTRTSAWIALKGKVYDVTNYVHPGGWYTLSQGVGTDATRLFNQNHSWVSFSRILEGKQVGVLVGHNSTLSP